MRRLIRSLLVVLPATALFAQQPAPPPPAAPPPPNPNGPLVQLLLQWEQAMKQVTTLSAQCTRKDTDKVIGQVKVWSGIVEYLAPNFVRLDLTDQADKNAREYYLLTPNALYEYKSVVQTVFIRQMPPPPPGQVAQANQFALLFGMTAQQALQRYTIQFAAKQDPSFHVLTVLPRNQEDQAEFTQAQLVLDKATLMPRQLWFQTPNQNEVLWQLPTVQPQAPVPPANFARPATPQGWREQVIPLPNAQPGAKP
jgi:TIGR03009 family protein